MFHFRRLKKLNFDFGNTIQLIYLLNCVSMILKSTFLDFVLLKIFFSDLI